MRTKKILFAVVMVAVVAMAAKIGYAYGFNNGFDSNETKAFGIKSVKEAGITENGHIVVLGNDGKAYLMPDSKTYATEKKSFEIGEGVKEIIYTKDKATAKK